MLSIRVKPETFEKVQNIAKRQQISQGEVIDDLVLGKNPSTIPAGAILAYLLPVQSSIQFSEDNP